MRFINHIQRHTTFNRTPLGERSARRRNLYLTTHNTHNRQTSMPKARFKSAIPGSERALERSATRIGRTAVIPALILNRDFTTTKPGCSPLQGDVCCPYLFKGREDSSRMSQTYRQGKIACVYVRTNIPYPTRHRRRSCETFTV